MNRREFIGIAGAAVVIPAPSVQGVVLFDTRYGESKARAAEFAAKGFLPLATNQDVVRLWYQSDVLRTAVRITGVTPHSDLDVVRRLLKEARTTKGLRLESAKVVRTHDRPGSLVSWQFA